MPVIEIGVTVDDLAIHELQGFGYEVDLDRIGAALGGRVVLIGNVNPMLIHSGRPEEVRKAAETWGRA